MKGWLLALCLALLPCAAFSQANADVAPLGFQ